MSTRRRPDVKIAIMGPTGTGKSSFVKLITGDKTVKIGHSIDSETAAFGLSHYFELDGRCVTFIDTPGFDDSREGVTDAVVLQQIAAFLEAGYQDGKPTLNGIIYMHRITDPRMGGVTIRNLKMFHKLCGSESLKNVVIVTTRWDKIDEKAGARREEELMTNPNFFKPLVDAHARFLRHDGTSKSAHKIMLQLLSNDPMTLQIQSELSRGTKLEDTEAGAELSGEMKGILNKLNEELRSLGKELEEAIVDKDYLLKTELEEEQDKLKQVMEKWAADKRRLEEGLDSVRLGTRIKIDAAERELEELRHSFLLAKRKDRSYSLDSDTSSADTSSRTPVSRRQTEFLTQRLYNQELKRPDVKIVREERSWGHAYDRHISEHEISHDTEGSLIDKVHSKLVDLLHDLRRAAGDETETNLGFGKLSKEMCQTSMVKAKEDRQWRELLEQLIEVATEALEEQKTMSQALRRWRTQALSRSHDTEAPFDKARRVEIEKQKEEISKLRSEVSEAKRLRTTAELDRKGLEMELQKMRLLLADIRKRIATFEDLDKNQKKEISSLRSQLSESSHSREEADLRSEKERKELEVKIEKQRAHLMYMLDSNGNCKNMFEQERKELEAALESQRRAILVGMEEQKLAYGVLIEKQREDISILKSKLSDKKSRRKETRPGTAREHMNNFRRQHRMIRFEMEKQKSAYADLIKKQKKQISALCFELSREKHLRGENSLSQEQERKRLKDSNGRPRSHIPTNRMEQQPVLEDIEEEDKECVISSLSSKLLEEELRAKEMINKLLKSEHAYSGIAYELEQAVTNWKRAELKYHRSFSVSEKRQAATEMEQATHRINLLYRELCTIASVSPGMNLMVGTKDDMKRDIWDDDHFFMSSDTLFQGQAAQERQDVTIAVMGQIGAGKSSFIRSLVDDNNVMVHDKLRSRHPTITKTHYFEPDGRCVTLVEFPGFDNSRIGTSDEDVLKLISSFMVENEELLGIIYLHRITDPRVGGKVMRDLRTFEKLCGEDAFKNIIILTTCWDEIDILTGNNREQELKADPLFFQSLHNAGARFLRHNNTDSSARQIMAQLIDDESVKLQIQRELEDGKELEDTAAAHQLKAETNLHINQPNMTGKNIETGRNCDQLTHILRQAEKEIEKVHRLLVGQGCEHQKCEV